MFAPIHDPKFRTANFLADFLLQVVYWRAFKSRNMFKSAFAYVAFISRDCYKCAACGFISIEYVLQLLKIGCSKMCLEFGQLFLGYCFIKK